MCAVMKLRQDPFRRYAHGIVLATVFAFLAISKVQAIDFRFSLGDQGENPSYDPDGTRLLAIMEAAALLWEDYMPDGGIHGIDLFWKTSDFDPDSNTLAFWDPQAGFEDNNIVFNARVLGDGSVGSWFFDPTPSDHSEFDFSTLAPDPPGPKGGGYQAGQWLYQDLAPTAQADGFTGSPPALLEVGYLGLATDPIILGQIDVLGVALHELGHELGISSATSETLNPNPAWVGGASLTFRKTSDSGVFDDDAHLRVGSTLMFPSVSDGVRKLPSAVDIMAGADARGHTNIDLPRQDYLGTGIWDDPTKWMGGALPDSNDEATIRSSANVSLTGFATARKVLVVGAADLSTGSNRLLADSITVSGFSSDVFIPTGGTVEANEVTIQELAEIEVSGGTLDAVSVQIGVDSQIESLSGGGTILVRGSLINDGKIIAASGGTLSISSSGPGVNRFNLDGFDESGSLDASNGNLNLQPGALTDSFSGTISVGASQFVSVDLAMTDSFSINGSLELTGGTTLSTAAEMRSVIDAIEFDGANVTVDGVARLAAPTTWENATTVDLVDSDARLYLGSNSSDPVTLGEATFQGAGRLLLQANMTVPSGETANINSASFDWDGTTGDSETVIHGRLNITGEVTDNLDAFLTLDGDLQVDSDWTLQGGMQTFGNSDILPGGVMTIDSQVFVDRRIGGSSRTDINTPTILTSNALVTLDSGSRLRLSDAVYRGVIFQGGRSICQEGNVVVEQNSTVGIDFSVFLGAPQWIEQYDWDGFSEEEAEMTIQSGATLTINAEAIDIATGDSEGYDGTLTLDGGSLVVNTGQRIQQTGVPIVIEAPWKLNGTMNLNQNGTDIPSVGSTVGSAMEIYGMVNANSGESNLDSPLTTLVEGSIFVASGATLNIGPFRAEGGITVVEEFGTLNLSDSTFTALASFGLPRFATVNILGNTHFEGGQYTGEGSIRQQGQAIVSANTQFASAISFASGSTTTINTDVILTNVGRGLANTGPAIVLAGANFEGDGTFQNFVDTALIMQPNAEMQIEVINSGVVAIGLGLTDSGVVHFKEFTQTDSGLLSIDLFGDAEGEFDAIAIDNLATLEGELDVNLIEDFTPSLGDQFEIVTAASIAGEFQATHLPLLGGLVWDIQYNATSVTLEVIAALATDTEPDGDVDGADFLTIQRTKPSLIPTWEMQYGTSAGLPGTAQQIPEPTGLLLAALSLTILGTLRFS